MRRIPLYLAPLCLLAIEAKAQVLITEAQPNPMTPYLDSAEWIELHNVGTAAVDISGYTISDYGPATPRQYAFPAGTVLAPDQVIIATREATEWMEMAVGLGFAVQTPNFEFDFGATDDLNIPNMTVVVMGSGGWGLVNSGSDGVLLRDAAGVYVDGMEYGTTDRAEIPGSPQTVIALDGQTLSRVSTTNNSLVDFQAGAPTPGVGFVAGSNIPPAIANTASQPRHVFFGASMAVTADVVDADPVTATLYSSVASSVSGPAGAAYTGSPMLTVTAPQFGGAVPAILVPPATFHDTYHRYYVSANDGTDTTTDPAMADSSAANTAYYWRNVMPQAPSTITEAREQGADELPTWRYHSVTVEGIALTTHQAFVNNTTNFFIQSPLTTDAIRIFSRAQIPETIAPGDLVRVTGMIDVFRGLRQVGESAAQAPDTDVTVISSGNPVPESTRTIAQLLADAEGFESQLVVVNNVTIVGAQATWPSNNTIDVDDGTGILRVFIPAIVNLANQPVPAGAFSMRAIFSQNDPTGFGGYQLQPRDTNDVFGAQPPVDAGLPDTGIEQDTGVDAGVPPQPDTGVPPPPDTGVPEPDSGMPDMDGGIPEMEGGVPEMDGSMPPPDSGEPKNDSGVPRPDTGVPSPDTGVIGGDDAGMTGGDAGPVRVDSGSGAGTSTRGDEGCGCNTTSAPNTTTTSLLALSLLGVVLISRRRR